MELSGVATDETCWTATHRDTAAFEARRRRHRRGAKLARRLAGRGRFAGQPHGFFEVLAEVRRTRQLRKLFDRQATLWAVGPVPVESCSRGWRGFAAARSSSIPGRDGRPRVRQRTEEIDADLENPGPAAARSCALT